MQNWSWQLFQPFWLIQLLSQYNNSFLLPLVLGKRRKWYLLLSQLLWYLSSPPSLSRGIKTQWNVRFLLHSLFPLSLWPLLFSVRTLNSPFWREVLIIVLNQFKAKLLGQKMCYAVLNPALTAHCCWISKLTPPIPCESCYQCKSGGRSFEGKCVTVPLQQRSIISDPFKPAMKVNPASFSSLVINNMVSKWPSTWMPWWWWILSCSPQ